MDIGYQRPCGLISPDLQLVNDAASILRLREFDLFRAAWRSWFGGMPDDKAVERGLVAFMFHQRVPHWVRHFARRVIHDGEAGHLDPERLGAAHYPRQRPLAELGEGYITSLYIVAAIIGAPW